MIIKICLYYDGEQNGLLLRPETQFDRETMERILGFETNKMTFCTRYSGELFLGVLPEDLSKIINKKIKEYYRKKNSSSLV